MKKVLIGITSRNRSSLLPNAIRSALQQSYPNKEVMVFDDASTDGTKLLSAFFPSVNWHLSGEPVGYLVARNWMMNTSDAEYFASLDDDAWFLEEDSLDLAIEFLDKHEEVAAIAFQVLSPDQSQPVPASVEEVNNFIGCGHLLRLKAIREVGFYAMNPASYGGEEKDLCIRLIDAGYKVVRMNGVRVWHEKSPISRNVALQIRSNVCNDLMFAYRRTPSVYLLPALLMKIVRHSKFAMSSSYAGSFKATLMGVRDFFSFIMKGGERRRPVSRRTFKTYLSLNK